MNMREKIARKLLMYDMPHVDSWQLIDERIRKDYMHRADAVLDALMEPTEEMISAADEAMRHKVVTGSARIETLKVGFLAMIQAAKEGK